MILRDTQMENHTNPSVRDLLDLVAKLEPAELERRYAEIVAALQARMQRDQEPFKALSRASISEESPL